MAAGGMVGLIFSKDRAMQLDAVLQSLYLHCQDIEKIELKVIYTVSSLLHAEQYTQLAQQFQNVAFIKESAFKTQVVASIADYTYVAFLVDDNLVVGDFSVTAMAESLQANADALGFSLRLGRNSSFCYPQQQPQACPQFIAVSEGFLKFNWTAGQYDFGYPLEVSSSMYCVSDLLGILQQAYYYNPNTLEIVLASHCPIFAGCKNMLLCNQYALMFCNPVNIVQSTCNNLSGLKVHYTIEQLAQLFAAGYRIDVEKYSGFVPHACHQEVALLFTDKWNKPEEVHR